MKGKLWIGVPGEGTAWIRMGEVMVRRVVRGRRRMAASLMFWEGYVGKLR